MMDILTYTIIIAPSEGYVKYLQPVNVYKIRFPGTCISAKSGSGTTKKDRSVLLRSVSYVKINGCFGRSPGPEG